MKYQLLKLGSGKKFISYYLGEDKYRALNNYHDLVEQNPCGVVKLVELDEKGKEKRIITEYDGLKIKQEREDSFYECEDNLEDDNYLIEG